jgi:TonB family protein
MKIFLSALCMSLMAAFGVAAAEAMPPSPDSHAKDNCDADYPKAALDAGADGTTVFMARISTSGYLQDAAVSKSSGRDDLDAAAASCAPHLYLKPALKDGAPIDVTLPFVVVWNHKGHSYFGLLRPPGTMRPCNKGLDRSAYKPEGFGATEVSFIVAEDGTVSQPAIVQSSGNASLDRAARDCVMRWRYPPATRDGKPIAFTWTAAVSWISPR